MLICASKRASFWITASICLLALFLLLRLPGVDLPYHQDEWKNVSASETVRGAGTFFAHPPLMQIAFVLAHEVFGTGMFRLFPLIVSILTGVLLYLVIKGRSGNEAALWSVFLYSISFYSVFGSLVPDVDGAILPFFFLLAVYAYDNWINCEGPRKKWWATLIYASLALGLLIKLSFVLAIAAIAADYLWTRRHDISLRNVGIWAGTGVAFAVTYVLILFVICFLYPAFDMGIMLGHANQFAENLGRNWIQIAVQGVKAVMYLSPLLVAPLLFAGKRIFRETRVFVVYLLLGLVFYFVVFDFSRGALDKYLMYAIVPLGAMAGLVLFEIFSRSQLSRKRIWLAFISGIILSAALFALNLFPHEVLPLYPKELWFKRAMGGEWTFLNPFNGGSGPLGFYISFLYISASFIVSILAAIFGIWKKEYRSFVAILIVVIGMTYNAVFTLELSSGRLNGSSQKALAHSIEFIRARSDIKNVITYNDIGAGPLSQMGKYAGRFYAAPQFEEGHMKLFAEHKDKGHFLVVGIPPLGKDTFYGRFFSECDSLFMTSSGVIRSNVYSCDK